MIEGVLGVEQSVRSLDENGCFALPKVPLYLFKIMEEKRVNIL
jgi:hypothetical protein